MSAPIQKICFIGGSPRSSGDVQTGEVQFVRGGGRAVSIFSGALFSGTVITTPPGSVPVNNAGDILLYSGGGRLNNLLQHVQMASGLAVTFYDAAVAVSGGPIPASGHKLIGIIPPTYPGGAAFSGILPVMYTGTPVNVDMPFQSGLCAHMASGSPGFTASFTPESNILNNGSVVGA